MSKLSTNSFRKSVDETSVADISFESNDLTSDPKEKKIASLIRENCPENYTHLYYEIRGLIRGLICESVLEQKPLDPYFQIASHIQSCLRNNQAPVDRHEETPNWVRIIELAKALCEIFPLTYRYSEETLRGLHNRDFAYADASRSLKNKGFSCETIDGIPSFQESERVRIIQSIEDKIALLGGYSVICHLCRLLQRNYSHQMKRYLRPADLSLNGKARNPSLPINLIIQLAVKQDCSEMPEAQEAEKLWSELAGVATDFAALYDCEPYSHWDLEFINVHTLSPYITDIALNDRMFGIRQYRFSDVSKVIQGLFQWVPNEIEKKIGFTIAFAAHFADRVLSKAFESGPTIYSREDLRQGLIDLPDAEQLLDAFIHSNRPNSQLTLPEMPGTLNFHFKPLIKLNDDDLLMVDRSICAPSFYEAIASVIRPHDKQTQNHIGISAERFLISELNAKDVSVLTGEYNINGDKGQCDAVIETTDTIIFLELKAKALTSAAQAGSDVRIYIDLLKSLFDSTFQSNRHEILLRQNGSLPLMQPDGTEILLNLKGREIEKVSVTLLDYGRFQDRTVLSQVMGSLLNAEIMPHNSEYSKEFKELNEKTAAIRGQVEILGSLDERYSQQPFFTCWFLSVPQILILLDRVYSNDSFKTELFRTRHMSTHSLEWYFEMSYAMKLKT